MTTKQKSNTGMRFTEYKARDAVIEHYENGIKYSGDSFRVYGKGVWKEVDQKVVQKAVAKDLLHWEAAQGLEPSYRLELSITNAIKSKVYTPSDQWNNQPNILVFQNTAFDVDQWEEVPHSKDHHATTALPYKYDPTATAPTWERVVNDLLGEEERNFFQEFAGYCLTTSVKHQIMLWLVGKPGGGKSTLVAGLEAMLGDLATPLGQSVLQSTSAKFALSNVPGKTLLTCTENPKGPIKATDTLNALVTGDTIMAEKKFKDAFKFRNTAKLLWAMNNVPGLPDANNGLFRRLAILEIPKLPDHKKDPNVYEKVRTESTGIINWSLEGLKRLNDRGYFHYPKSVSEATARFKQDNDLQQQFLLDDCELPPSEQLFYTDKYTVLSSNLTEAYNAWAMRNGHRPWSTKELAKEWERLGLVKGKRTKKGQPWHGVMVV